MAKQQSLKPMITQYHLSTTLPRHKIPVPDACRGDSGRVLTGEILEIPKYLNSTKSTCKSTAVPSTGHCYGVVGTRDDNEAIIGTASYTPLQGWSNSKKYAFFAFYPTPDENVTLVNLDEENTPYSGGVPAIKYTNPTFDVEKMKDVMTANCYTDLFWKSSTEGGNNIPSGEVNFKFDHKLSCLEVRVKESSAASINITDFTLTLSGVQYEGIIIPLNGDNNKLITSQSATHSISLPLISREISSGPEFQNIGDLLLIPQDDNISISLNVDYSRKYGDNTTVDANFNTSTPLTTTLIKGTKHFLQLDFGDKNVYVMQSSSGWDEKNVKHEFN